MEIQCYYCRKLFNEEKNEIILFNESKSIQAINYVYACEKCFNKKRNAELRKREDKLICKECGHEWDGFIIHILKYHCFSHLKFWKMFTDEKGVTRRK